MNRPSRVASLRLVFVDVIERESGIETTAPAEIDAFAQPPAGFHARAHDGKLRTAAQLQPFVFLPGVAEFVGVEQ